MFCKWLTSYMHALRVAIEFCGFSRENALKAAATAAFAIKISWVCPSLSYVTKTVDSNFNTNNKT